MWYTLKQRIKLILKYGFNIPNIKSVILLQRKKDFSLLKFSLKGYENPVFIRNNTSDIDVFNQIMLKQEYDINSSIIPRTILDCGANIGLATLYFNNKFPHAKIIAIEPESSNFEILEKNCLNIHGVSCIKAGIWNKDSNLIVEDTGQGKFGFMVKETNKKNEKTTEALSISSIMQKYDLDYIDILKIDIEGSEKELFESNTEYWLPKTHMIIIELHDLMKEGCSNSFFSALVKYKFSTSLSGENIICYINNSIER